MDKDAMICYLCRFYNTVTYFCKKHPEYGKLVERDSCDDYVEVYNENMEN